MAAKTVTLPLDLPPAIFPVLIGKGGTQRRQLESEFGVRLLVPSGSPSSSEPAVVQGPAEACERAKREIRERHRHRVLALDSPCPETRRGPLTEQLLAEKDAVLGSLEQLQEEARREKERAEELGARADDWDAQVEDGRARIRKDLSTRLRTESAELEAELQEARAQCEAMAEQRERMAAAGADQPSLEGRLSHLRQSVRTLEEQQQPRREESDRMEKEIKRLKGEADRFQAEQVQAERQMEQMDRECQNADAANKGNLPRIAEMEAALLRTRVRAMTRVPPVSVLVDNVRRGLSQLRSDDLVERLRAMADLRMCVKREIYSRVRNPPGMRELEEQLRVKQSKFEGVEKGRKSAELKAEDSRKELRHAEQVCEQRAQELNRMRDTNWGLHEDYLQAQIGISRMGREMDMETSRSGVERARERELAKLMQEGACLQRELQLMNALLRDSVTLTDCAPDPDDCVMSSRTRELKAVMRRLNESAGI
eukprot:TRINITY_DN40225_c0_g1_i1.p1 TRINITY_DN40225_c0_g1~~TRINITY_DN40225_c0_g1_i1.p1  ORF type:complete len:507 (+),score=201.17 TRINITY_DN40225_c0_g1_i1:74-1522(+)